SGFETWQFQDEGAAAARLAFEANRSAVGLDDSLDQRQANPDAANASPLGSSAHEFLKDLPLFGGRDALAMILHSQEHRTCVTAREYSDCRIRLRVLSGILQQIPDCARERFAISPDRRQAFFHLANHFAAAPLLGAKLFDNE